MQNLYRKVEGKGMEEDPSWGIDRKGYGKGPVACSQQQVRTCVRLSPALVITVCPVLSHSYPTSPACSAHLP